VLNVVGIHSELHPKICHAPGGYQIDPQLTATVVKPQNKLRVIVIVMSSVCRFVLLASVTPLILAIQRVLTVIVTEM
jgi:hypothetical protein